MSSRLCPHDQTVLIEAKQLFYPVNLHSVETTRLQVLLSGPGDAQPNPFACATCGYVGFYLDPGQVAALNPQ